EPGQKNFFMPYSFTGSFPDYTSAPRRPYRPSKDDFRKRAAWRRRKLWMIPQSTARLDWELEPANGDNGKMDSSSGNGASARRPAGSAPLDASSVYEGHLDRVDPQMIWGWAYDATRPNEPIEVEIYADEMLVATIPASCLRPDLSAAGKGDGRHAFCIHIPNRLKDGEPHSVRVKVAGSDFELSGSPKEIHFAQGDWDEEFLLTLNTNPWVMGRAVDRLLGDLEAPYLALPVRTDVGINPIELSNMEQNLSQLMSHPLVKRFVFTTPDGLVKRVG
ncbi:MAG TPA: hypothetical protein VJT09_17140, partial [Pyrinomonadaceae bacterium]|nr:hypothetical protein [Pyrinomonadaceae bacterium]